MADNGIAKFVDLIRDMIKEEIDKTDSTVVCKVVNKVHYGAYEDRFDLNVEPDENNVIKNIQNASGCELSVGDYVYVYKIDNKLNNCFIFKKIGENTSSSYISIMQDKISTLVTKDDFATSITQTAEEISLRATYKEMESEISQKASEIYAQVVKKNDNNSSTGFGWSITVEDGFIVYHTVDGTRTNILQADEDGLEITGKVTATSGYIGNGSNGFTIGNTAISNGTKGAANSVYIGTDGIYLGANFIVDNQGNVTARTLKTISLVTIKYGKSDSISSQPTDWYDSLVLLDPQIGDYVWTWRHTDYTNSTSDDEYSVTRTGEDGTSVEIKGTVATYEDLPSASSVTVGDGYIVNDATGHVPSGAATEGVLFTSNGTSWVYCGQIKGPKGDSAVAYWISLSTPVHTGTQQSADITITAMKNVGTSGESQDVPVSGSYPGASIRYKWGSGSWSSYVVPTSYPYTIPRDTTTSKYYNENLTIEASHLNSGTRTVYETETITYSPLNTPVLDLNNDGDAIAYTADGTQKITATDTVTSTAALYLNGSAITSGVTYSWSMSGCTATGSTTTATIIINALSVNSATATCTATYQNLTYTKIFTITKQYKGTTGDTGNGISISQRYYGIGTNGTSPSSVSTWEGPDPSTIPTPSEGQFLWTKIVDTYTNGDVKNSYSVSYKAKDGTSIDIKGSVATYNDLDDLTGLTIGDCYIVNSDTHHTPGTTLEGTMYIYKGLDTSQAKIWNYCGQLKGPKGDTGDPGADATSYWFDIDSLVHMGSAQASTIDIVVWKQEGDGTPGTDTDASIVVTINGTSTSHSGGSYELTLSEIQSTSSNIIVQAKHSSTTFLNATIVYSPKNTPTLTLTRESSAITYKGTTKTGTNVSSQGILYLNGSALNNYYFTWSWDSTECTATTSQTLVSGDTITVSALDSSTNETTLTCTAHNNATIASSTETYVKYFTVVKQIDGVDGDGTTIEFEYAYWYSSSIDAYPSPDKPSSPGSTEQAETWYISTTEPTTSSSKVIVYRSYRTKTTVGSGTPTYSSWSAGELFSSWYTSSQRDTLRIANKLFGYGQGVYYTVVPEHSPIVINDSTYYTGDIITQSEVLTYISANIKSTPAVVDYFKLYINAEYLKANWVEAGDLTANSGKIAGFTLETGVLSYGTKGQDGSIYISSNKVIGFMANNGSSSEGDAKSKLIVHGLKELTLYIRSYSSVPISDYVITSKVNASLYPTTYSDTNTYAATYNTSSSDTSLDGYQRVHYSNLNDGDYILIVYRHMSSDTNTTGQILLPDNVVYGGTTTTLTNYIEWWDNPTSGSYYFSRISSLDVSTSAIELGSHFKVNSAGNITSTGGTIGGFTITSNSLSYGTEDADDSIFIKSGSGTASIKLGTKFAVDSVGVLTATDGNFSGTITSTAGTIGGFTIGDYSLRAGVLYDDDFLQLSNKLVAYKSNNYHIQSSYAVLKLTATIAGTYTIYIRSYAETNYDYMMASTINSTNYPTVYNGSNVEAHTRGNQKSGTTLSDYTEVSYDLAIDDYIYVVYKKDSTTDADADRGYLLLSPESLLGLTFDTTTTSYTFELDSTFNVSDSKIIVGNNFIANRDGVYIGAGAITLGAAFSVDESGNLTTQNTVNSNTIVCNQLTSDNILSSNIVLPITSGGVTYTQSYFTGAVSGTGSTITRYIYGIWGQQTIGQYIYFTLAATVYTDSTRTTVTTTPQTTTLTGNITYYPGGRFPAVLSVTVTILAGGSTGSNTAHLDSDMMVLSPTNIGETQTFTIPPSYGIAAHGDVVPSDDDTYDLGWSSKRWDDVYATNNVIQTSDQRYKTNINYDLNKYNAFFDQMKPSSFQWANGSSGRTHIGFIAQDIYNNLIQSHLTTSDFAGFIKSVKTESSTKDPSELTEDDYIYGLRYGEFIGLLISQVQSLKARVLELENKEKEVKGE